ncbi:hypothetical protein RI065_02470 [Mycoplasmatota bacterium zrk1]
MKRVSITYERLGGIFLVLLLLLDKLYIFQSLNLSLFLNLSLVIYLATIFLNTKKLFLKLVSGVLGLMWLLILISDIY